MKPYDRLINEIDTWSHLLDEPLVSEKAFLIYVGPLDCKEILISMKKGLTKEAAYGKLSINEKRLLLKNYTKKGE